MKWILSLVIVALLVCVAKTIPLKMVIGISRTGARYPLKEYTGQDWIKVPGGVNEVGLRQQYLLGRELRKRYAQDTSLLDTDYMPFQFYYTSADDRRSLMSAYAQLAGIYMAGTSGTLTPYQQTKAVPPYAGVNFTALSEGMRDTPLPHFYQTVPVHAKGGEAGEVDGILHGEACKQYGKYLTDFLNLNETKSMIEKEDAKHKDLYELIKTSMKWPEVDLMKAVEFHDLIESAYYLHIEVFPWVGAHILELQEIENFYQYNISLGSQNSSRVLTSELFVDMMNWMESGKEKHSSSEIKYVMYMTHEANLAAVIKALNITIPHVNITNTSDYPTPAFSSVLLLEISQLDSMSPFMVKVNLNDKYVKEYTMEKFLENYLNSTENQISNYTELCTTGYIPQPAPHDDTVVPDVAKGWKIFGILLFVFFLLTISTTCYFINRKPKGQNVSYEAGEDLQDIEGEVSLREGEPRNIPQDEEEAMI